jgi:hypothetical protein
MAGMSLDAGLRGRGSFQASSGSGAYTPMASSTPTRPTAASTMGISSTGAAASGSRKIAGPGAVTVGMISIGLLVFIYFSLPKG